MYCKICGQEIPEQKICPKCGCPSGYVPPNPVLAKLRESKQPILKAACIILVIFHALYAAHNLLFTTFADSSSILNIISWFLSSGLLYLACCILCLCKKYQAAATVLLVSGGVPALFRVISSIQNEELGWLLYNILGLAVAVLFFLGFTKKKGFLLWGAIGISFLRFGIIDPLLVGGFDTWWVYHIVYFPFSPFTFMSVIYYLEKRADKQKD